MERVQVLIDKLNRQKQNNDSPAQMLITVQMLQNELFQLQMNAVAPSAKVAVVMPMSRIVETKQPEIANTEEVEKVEEILAKNNSVLHQPETNVEELQHTPVQEEEHKVYFTLKEEDDHSFDPMKETPTLLHQREKEIHEVIAQQKESLNDKLKFEKKELGHVLKETPVKDLRKAIGINDRFVFVQELFRGDEVMYERSIKTINNFQVLQEAEYWINRELKVKLGWNDNRDTVQHFYQIVRRRFS